MRESTNYQYQEWKRGHHSRFCRHLKDGKQHCISEYHIDGMDEFCDKHKLPRMTQEETENQNSPIARKAMVIHVWFPSLTASATPGNFLKCKSSGPTPDLWSQNSGGESQQAVF